MFSADLLDYAHPEVRAWWVAVITDIAARFEVDGVELDFMRNPFFFGPDRVAAGRPLMTAFVREVRGVLDEAGRRRGRHLGLAARCPTALAGCDAIGLDVEAWVRDGLLDVLIPSPTRTNKFETDLTPFTTMSRGTRCQVLAGVDTVMPNQTWEQTRALQDEDRLADPAGMESDADYRVLKASRHNREGKRGVLEGMPVNLWRALAANAYLDGADGIYVFNLWDQVARHGRHLDGAILRDGRSAEALARRDKLYCLDFEIGGVGVGHPHAHLAQPASLPLVLTEGEPAELRLKVADALADAPERRSGRGAPAPAAGEPDAGGHGLRVQLNGGHRPTCCGTPRPCSRERRPAPTAPSSIWSMICAAARRGRACGAGSTCSPSN